MTSFFSLRGFGLGHRDCTRRLLYGMIVYTAGGTRRRADTHEAWRSRRWRKVDHDQAAVARGAVARRAKGGERRDAQAWSSLARGKECWRRDVGCALLAAGCWLLLLAVGGLAAGELQPRRWPTVGRFQPWAAASEQAEGSGWTKGNTEKEEGNNTTTLR